MSTHPPAGLALRLAAILCLAALCWPAADVLAGPAYRRLATNDPAAASWRDGITVFLAVDEERCRKAYGDRWSRECAAPPAGREGALVSGVTMTPAVPGTWRWAGSGALRFTPETRLAPDTAYRLSLAKVSLPARFQLASREIVFRTQPQAVSAGRETVWIDPSKKAGHVVSVPLSFIWPIQDRAAMAKRVSIAAQGGAGPEFADQSLVWNEAGDGAVFNARISALPAQNASAVLVVRGMPAFLERDGRRVISQARTRDVQARMQIPGSAELMNVEDIKVVPDYDEGLSRTRTLEITTSLQVMPGDVLRHLHLVLLPRRSAGGTGRDCDWTAMPAISADDIANGDRLTATLLQPENEPSTLIRMRVPAEPGRHLMAAVRTGLTSTGGLVLNRVRRFIRKVPDAEAEIGFLQPGGILAFGAEQRIDIHAVGVTSIRWRAERVRGHFLSMLARTRGFTRDEGSYHDEDEEDIAFDAMAEAREGEIAIPGGAPGKAAFPALNPADLLASGGRGLMRLVLSGMRNGERVCRESRLILITDLGLMYKTAADGSSTAFVRGLSSGAPVSGAEVRLLGANGDVVLSARTDAAGRADLPPARGLEREKAPAAVVAVLGDDMTWLSLSESSRRVDYGDFAVGGRSGSPDGLVASVFSQRGIFMPGETLRFGCLVRRFDWRALPEGLLLEADLHDPAGARVMRRKLPVGPDGLVSLEWKTPESAPAGPWRLDVKLAGASDAVLGSASVRVEEFQPDTLALRVDAKPGLPNGWLRGAPGAKAEVVAHLDNLYGDPAAGHRLKAVLRAEPARLAFPGYEDYVFHDLSSLEGETQVIELPDLVTNDKGDASIILPLEKLRAGTSGLALVVEGLELAGGRAVARTLQSLVSPRDVVLGWRPEGGANNLEYVPQDAAASLHLLALDNDLKPRPLKDVSAVFSARRFVNSLVRDSSGAWRYDATPVDTEISRAVISLDGKGASLPLPTKEAGDFLLTLRDAAGEVLASIPYGVAGLRLAAPDTLDPDSLKRGILRLRLEKEHYEAGEEIRFRISTPFAGTGLATLEREGVAAHAWFQAGAGESVQAIRIPKDFEGRGYLNVSFVRSRDSQAVYMNPHAYAVAPFTAGIARRAMGLSLSAPETIRPGQKVTVRLNSRLPGRVQIFAADEGVLQLTGFRTPDPLTDLLADRALDVQTRQAFDLLMPDHARLRGRIPGFGGGMGGAGGRFLNPFRRRGEPPFSWWSPIMEINGSLEAAFTVPDYFAGRIRVMAVGTAASPDGLLAAGSCQAASTVRGMLVLKPQLPLAVAPGDEFEGALVVGNTVAGSGPAAPVTVRLEPPAGLALVGGGQDFRLAVDENGEKAVTFRMRADDAPGEAVVRFTATLGAGEGFTRAQSLSIRPASPRRRTAAHGPAAVGPDGVLRVPSRRSLQPFEARTRLSLAAGPMPALRSVLERLDAYPYGCTEQLVSRAMPLVALWNAPEIRAMALKGVRRSEDEQRVRGEEAVAAAIGAVRRSLSWQGVAIWPGGEADLFMTAWAADFLVLMRESGMAVPEDLAGDVLDALERMVSRTPEDADDARRMAYGVWVLLRDGRIMTNALKELETWALQNIDGWQGDVMASLMAESYGMLRMRRNAERLLPEGDVRGTDDALLSGGVARGLHALILRRAFSEKERPQPVAGLVDAALSENATTAGMAMTARALIAAAKDAPAAPGADLRCAERAPGFAGGDAQAERLGGMLSLDAPGCRVFEIRGAPGAGGDLFWHLEEEGFDRTPPPPASNGLELSRAHLDAAGAPAASARLGDVITVRLCGRSPGAEVSNVVISDLTPGGLEPILEKEPASAVPGLIRYERREDRAIFFVNLAPEARCFSWRARAATRGRFVLPSAQAEAMHDPAVNASAGGGILEVR